MARLGELLVAAKLLDQDQVDRALRAQVMWGGRLGTNLIELGMLDLESISRALGRQHGLPAALARHFEKADRELQQRLPEELARQWSAVPLLHIGPNKAKVAVAVLDPLPPEALAQLATELFCTPDAIVVSVAAEMRVRYHLERVYGIARPSRYLRSKGSSVTPFPQFDNVPEPIDSDIEIAVPIAVDDTAHPTGRASAPAEPPPPAPAPPPADVDEISALIDEAIAQATAVEATEPVGRDRRTYLRTLADAPGPGVPARQLGRLAIRRLEVAETRPVPTTFADATRAIRRASNRDRLSERVIDALQRFVPVCEAAVLLVVRGDVATSWGRFSRSNVMGMELAVPLDRPGLVPTAIERNAPVRSGVAALGPIDQALLRTMMPGDGELRGDLVVVPVAIADQVMSVIATTTPPDAAVEGVETVAASAATAFARLIRDAAR